MRSRRTGRLQGLITDSSGAAVQDAKIIATNTETGVTYVSTTNGSGVYVLSQLVPGLYKVSLSKEGFGTVERTELTVRTGDHLSLDLSIKPATTRDRNGNRVCAPAAIGPVERFDGSRQQDDHRTAAAEPQLAGSDSDDPVDSRKRPAIGQYFIARKFGVLDRQHRELATRSPAAR